MKKKQKELKETNCYTYKVEMIVQVLAPNETIASFKLDSEGGYVSSRKTFLLDSLFLYDESEEEDQS